MKMKILSPAELSVEVKKRLKATDLVGALVVHPPEAFVLTQPNLFCAEIKNGVNVVKKNHIRVNDGLNVFDLAIVETKTRIVEVGGDTWRQYCSYRGLKVGDKVVLATPDKIRRYREWKLSVFRNGNEIEFPDA